MTKIPLLFEIEKKFDLNQFTIDDCWIYPIVKQSFLVPAITHTNPDKQMIERSMNRYPKLLNDTVSALWWSIKNKPLTNYDFIISEYASSRMFKHGQRYYSIWTDYLYDDFPEKKILTFERPAHCKPKHRKQFYSKNIFYPDFQIQKLLVQSKLRQKKINVPVGQLKIFSDYLDISIDQKSVREKLWKFFAYVDLYLNFFKKTRPALVILNNSYEYSVMAMIYSCKKLNIKTIELQHGFISHSHPGYIYTRVLNRMLFPDYLFTYGDYFTKIMQQNTQSVSRENIITTGFPFIEKVKKLAYSGDQKTENFCRKNDVIYFTSQWTVRHMLKDFVLELSRKIPENFKILYKTHPREKFTEQFYDPFKSRSNIQLISHPETSSLEIMKLVKIHSTVYSTSFFESLFFGLPNILIFQEAYLKNVSPFVDNRCVYLVKDPDEYIQKLEILKHSKTDLTTLAEKRAKNFFQSDAHDNIRRAIINIESGTRD